jgi:hypothetical protein
VNWAALKAAVTAYANRSDLVAQMPTFLAMAEQRIYAGSVELGVGQMLLSRMLVVVPSFDGVIPADSVQLDRLTAVAGGRRQQLEFRPLGEITALQAVTGQPAHYSLQGASVVYGPALGSGVTVELLYFARLPTPVADADENWLMASAPAVYLHAMLAEVGQYLRDAELRDSELKLWSEAQRAVMAQDDQDVHSGSQLRIVNTGMRRW